MTEPPSRQRDALVLAERWHAGQQREADGAAFALHLREVAVLLEEAGADEHVVAAGALHDVLEKTHVTRDELARHAGEAVTRLVEAVSEDPAIAAYGPRKRKLRERAARGGPEALQVLAADKVSKVRELRLKEDAEGEAHRLEHYAACLLLLEEHLPRSPLTRRLREELQLTAR